MAEMEKGQSDTDSEECTPANCRRKSNDEDNPPGTTDGSGSTVEDAGNKDVDEESADECLTGDVTDEDDGDRIEDMYELGACVTKVKFQTVQQQSYHLVGKDTTALAQHIVGCCQQPQGEIASTSQQGTQLQQASAADVDQTTSQLQLSTTTSCVVPETTIAQVPRTAALTPASTSSLLPRIPGSVVSEIQSSGLPGVPVPVDSPSGVQYNKFYVQQNFGDVTVRGARNLNFGGTQNIRGTQNDGAPRTNQEEEKHLTAAQKIRKRTESRIQSWTKDMVETKGLQKVTDKLDRGATWVTIKGRPGEGKSTIAYMALKDQHTQGRQVYQVVSPEEFNEVITASIDPVIMLDDIFGDLEFDVAEWAKWRPSLQPVVDVKDPDKYTEKDPIDKSTNINNGLKRTKDEQTELKRTAPNKDQTIIILVGRDYVLKSSLADLGKMADYISSPLYVVEVSSQRDSYERRKIWHVHVKTKTKMDFDESTVSQICQADCPHGFPHVCKMFVTTYGKDQTQLSAETVLDFFKMPLVFLKKTLDKFLKDKIKRSLFMAMIKRDGKISGQELEENGYLAYESITAADDLVGSYLKKEDDTYMFDHPSIYDSIALILSTKQSKFVIENCSLSFIHQRLRLKPSTRLGENVPSETGLVANISWTFAGHLARRFATEIERGNFLHVLSHETCCNSKFIDLLMDCLKTNCHMSVPDLLKLADNSSRQYVLSDKSHSFCELLSSNKSHHLIKFIMEKENISFSQNEKRDILLGVCKNAACSVLTYISEHMKLDMDARYGRLNVTPIMLAAETKNSEFVDQILALAPDLNACDKLGNTVFHYLCKYGLTSAVEQAINTGVDVNVHRVNGALLYLAIKNGHLGVVKLLVKTGFHLDNQKGLRIAFMSQNKDMVDFLLDRGAQVDGDAVNSACKVGNLTMVKMLLEKGATVNMMSSNGDTPLHSSCRRHSDVMSFLLAKGASVNQLSSDTGDAPLHTAAHRGYTVYVNVLLKAGADVNVQNKTGDTPLHTAAHRGYTVCVDVLLKAGADVNVQKNTGDTPLHTAAHRGYTVCVDVLLKAGADVNVQKNTGDTPLHTAAGRWGSADCVVVLLKAGADVNEQNKTGDTPLHTAAAGWGCAMAVEVLLKAGPDVNVQNNTGDTPLHTAAFFGSKNCVEVLLKGGADVNVQNKIGDTPLHTAVAGWGSAMCVEMLLKAGADVNVQNKTGDTTLHTAAAAWLGSAECVEMLLKGGADVNVQNNRGDTPLHTAADSGSTELIEVLLKAGADVNVQNNTSDTPLHTAADSGSTECIEVLLKARADVNVQNKTGDTPLHTAAADEEYTVCVNVLLKAGADVNVQNNTGDTPLHTAAKSGSTECIEVLLEAGADMNVQNKTGDTPLLKAGADVSHTTL
ncbi:uncharacterized protein LOC125378936 [Haliotis rufescens]|uniref:uncharacterized protein LOC125378936 n=1 Tax=Haliotis rufescens TaxID=6454 RepID=UPI00201E7CA7|nr:uncharacterized protein LOC125378936 [Haliotis rufescens]